VSRIRRESFETAARDRQKPDNGKLHTCLVYSFRQALFYRQVRGKLENLLMVIGKIDVTSERLLVKGYGACGDSHLTKQ
jgi:hypothetical protein